MAKSFEPNDMEMLKKKYGLDKPGEKTAVISGPLSCSCQSGVTNRSAVPLPIYPGDSIGPLKLGMDRSEMEAQLGQLCQQVGMAETLYIGCKETSAHSSGYLLRYFMGRSMFLVDYNEQHRAISISVHRDTSSIAEVTLFGQPVFSMEAIDLMSFLQEKDDCVFDTDDALFCSQFTCPRLGLRLWRDFGPSPEQVANPNWKEKLDEDESFLLTFPLVTVFNPEYGSQLYYL